MGRDSVATREQGRAKYVAANVTGHANEHSALMTTYVATLAALFLLGLAAFVTSSAFFIDAIISIVVVSIFYYYRHAILFSWEGTLFAAAGWLMNMAGVLGAYELHWGVIGWDKALHFVSIFGLTLLAYAYLERKEGFSPLELVAITFFIVQGFGAINEIAEFIGAYYFGVGQGLFGLMNGLEQQTNVIFDTYWDMVANTVAITVGLAYIFLKRRAQSYNTQTSSPPSWQHAK